MLPTYEWMNWNEQWTAAQQNNFHRAYFPNNKMSMIEYYVPLSCQITKKISKSLKIDIQAGSFFTLIIDILIRIWNDEEIFSFYFSEEK